jgi:hypothetical protein
MPESKITDLAAWLAEQADNVQFGEISVKIILHDGKARVEKSITIRELAS